MKKFIKEKGKKFLMVLVTFISIFAFTGCNDDEEKDGAGYSFTYTLHGNPQNLDPQLATDKSSLMIIKNMFSGLMTIDNEGKITGNVALSYNVLDNGLKYSFILRDDCYWHSADGTESVVTAHDFVYAFKRIYNPVTQSPYKEKFSFIKNAEAIINGEMDYSQLGVYAINNTELVFEFDRPCTEFLYLLTTAPAMPCNKQFFEGTKARYGLDDESVISNGAFYMTQWSYDPYGNDNLIYMKRNYSNTEYDRIYPYMITFIIERNKENVLKNFDSAYSDCMVSESKIQKSSIGNYQTQKFKTGSVGIVFNESCKMDDSVKKAMASTLNREIFENMVTDNFSVAYGIVPESISFSGASYQNKNISDYKETLEALIALNPEHISSYSLIVEEGTPFYELYAEGKEKAEELPDEECDREMYAKKRLKEAGYERYEISNYAKQGFESRHNSSYWTGIPYLGVGLGASSLFTNARYHNESDLNAYLAAVQAGEDIRKDMERLVVSEQMEEFMMLGLRMMRGVSRSEFQKRFGCAMETVYGQALKKLERNGLIVLDGDRVALTETGIDVSNQVFVEFVPEDFVRR